MSFDNWAVIFATLAGPVLAVQAQKMVERLGEAKKQKEELFRTLMVTRGTRLAFEHVRALNSIDVIFSSKKKDEKRVIEAWRLYAQNLNQSTMGFSEAQNVAWQNRNDDLFLDLLEALAKAVGFEAERERLRGAYLPVWHAEIELAQRKTLDNAARVLAGEQPIKMEVVSFPAIPAEPQREQLNA